MKKPKNRSKKKSKTNAHQSVKNKHGIKSTPIKIDTIRIIFYACSLIFAISAVFVGKFSSHPNPQYFIWSLFVLFLFAEVSFCLYWFIHKPQLKQIIIYVFIALFLCAILSAIFLPLVFLEKTKIPTFTDAINNKIEPTFSLGTSGMSFTGVGRPILFGEYEPFKPFIINNKLYVDVEIYSDTGFPPIKIIRNVLHNLPNNWDRNSNDIALEIVNENKKPVYQLLYKEPFNLNIKGIFPYSNGVLIADDISGISMISYNMLYLIPAKFRLKRIFKYPSWRYPGEYNENY